MTNKPMLSVERELLETVCNAFEAGQQDVAWQAASKLRALIDKPALVDAYPEAGLIPAELVALLRADLRESIEAAKLWLASNANGGPVEEGHLGCVATAIEMLRLGDSRDQLAGDFLDKPAAQHQGEPVMPGSEEFSYMSTIELRGYHAGWYAACIQNRSAEKPAPVAVVMPERKPAEWRGISATFASGWNACLDEVARLNGVKP